LIANNYKTAKKKQGGIALLFLVIVITLAMTSYYLSTISITESRISEAEKTSRVLKEAKQALLDYAVINWRGSNNGGKIGKLPCPDYSISANEGAQDGSCGKAYANAIGLFPWREFGIEVPKEAGGACIIYVVSPAYKNSPAAALNPDSYGHLQIVDSNGVVIQGNTPEDRPVAMLIAPGPTLSGQARRFDVDSVCGLDFSNTSAYLDNDGTTNNAALDDQVEYVVDSFVNSYPGSSDGANPLNDRLITITHDEFWSAMESTLGSIAFTDKMTDLTEVLAKCMAAYGANNSNHLPMPAPLNLSTNPVIAGEYRRDVDYDDSALFVSGYSGRFPYDVSNANTKLLNSDEDHLFENTYCNGLVTSLSGETVDFEDSNGSDKGVYLNLWKNWKDHFFYAVSKAYNPAAAATACSSECVELPAGDEHAAIIFYSGLKDGGQSRYQPPFDSDEKVDPANYLEDGNDVFFPDNTGKQIYNSVSTGNDVMFCIETDMSVVAC
jgi:hypothetical protein